MRVRLTESAAASLALKQTSSASQTARSTTSAEAAVDHDFEQAPEPVAEIAAETVEQVRHRPEQQRRQAR